MILRPLFCFKDTKNTGLLIFNSLKQKKLIFNFVVNRNWKKLTDSRKRAKILADNRKSYHPIETLYCCLLIFLYLTFMLNPGTGKLFSSGPSQERDKRPQKVVHSIEVNVLLQVNLLTIRSTLVNSPYIKEG